MSARSSESPLPRLITGMPRAATTWLCRCFNEHPDTTAFGETLYWGRGYIEPRSKDGRYTPEQVNAILERLNTGECITSVLGDRPGALRHVDRGALPGLLESARTQIAVRPTPAELFLAVCNAIRTAESKSIVVEKTPHHVNWLDRIMAAMPGVKVVVLLREPYSFMLSYKHQGDRKRPHVRRSFEQRYHPLACALVWRKCMKAAQHAQSQYPQHILVVQNEEIWRDPAEVLNRVQQFYDLPTIVPGGELASKVQPENTSFPAASGEQHRPELQADDVFWMNFVAGRTMATAGYERRSVPHASLRIAWSAARLPIWAIRNVFSLRSRVGGSLISYLWRWMHSPKQSAGVANAR